VIYWCRISLDWKWSGKVRINIIKFRIRGIVGRRENKGRDRSMARQGLGNAT
jgi:hypothetical protein